METGLVFLCSSEATLHFSVAMLDTVWKKKDKNYAFESIRMFFFFLK